MTNLSVPARIFRHHSSWTLVWRMARLLWRFDCSSLPEGWRLHREIRFLRWSWGSYIRRISSRDSRSYLVEHLGNKSGVRLIYVGMGLAVAGAFSNQVASLVFGHVTDFLFFWVPVIRPSYAVANLADIMIVGGLIIIFVVAPLWRRLSLEMALIEREENETRSQSG